MINKIPNNLHFIYVFDIDSYPCMHVSMVAQSHRDVFCQANSIWRIKDVFNLIVRRREYMWRWRKYA